MHRKRLTMVLAIFAASAVGLGMMIGTASGQVKVKSAAKVAPVTIKVTAGKPTEFAFKLSKTANIPVGKVIFVVTNMGVIGHSFKVCKSAATTSAANACVGSATKVLNKGQSATLTVVFTKAGKYEFLCTVSGHAANGMKGLVGIGTALTAADAKPVTVTTPAAGAGAAGGAGAATTCASPQTTNLNVTMIDFSFSGVPPSVPCGTIIFHDTNAGATDHNLTVLGVGAAGIGPIVSPGGSGSSTVTLTPGQYNYQCDVGDHAANGMVGSFRVLP